MTYMDFVRTTICRGCGNAVRLDEAREVRRPIPDSITSHFKMIGCVWIDLYHLDCLPSVANKSDLA